MKKIISASIMISLILGLSFSVLLVSAHGGRKRHHRNSNSNNALAKQTSHESLRNELEETGILVLAHGGENHDLNNNLQDSKSNLWDNNVEDAVEYIRNSGCVNVEIAFGIADRDKIQKAVNKLESDPRLKRIIAIPLFISSHSPVVRKSAYLLDAATNVLKERTESAPIEHKVPIYMTTAIIDVVINNAVYSTPTVMLMEKINKLNNLPENPKRITVIIVSHGANNEDDNRQWLNNMAMIASELNDYSKKFYKNTQMPESLANTSFKNVLFTTVRDDAPRPIQEEAKKILREMVKKANDKGDMVVIAPLLISSGGIEQSIYERLEGLNCVMSEPLLPSKHIDYWFNEKINTGLTYFNLDRKYHPPSDWIVLIFFVPVILVLLLLIGMAGTCESY